MGAAPPPTPTTDPAILVGLTAEARLLRPLGWRIGVGGGSSAGAMREAERLIRGGAGSLVSVGLAGGLDPALRPGAILVPRAVSVGGQVLDTDPAVAARLGGMDRHLVLASDSVVATAAAKRHLLETTGAVAVDMESGAVALAAGSHGLPFAVLRVICDPAETDLPPAALIALGQGGAIGLGRVIASILGRPGQLPSLMRLAADAAAARRALAERVARLAHDHTARTRTSV